MSKTRRGSLAERRPIGGYIGRAMSELVLIVVGVLVALSADQWRASWADARTEAEYLSRMADDVAAALRQLDSETQRTQSYLAAAAELSKLPRRTPGITEDSLAVLVADALFNIVSWDSRLSTLDDLKNTGRLGLISDPEIREALADVDRLTAGIRDAEDDILQTQHQTLDPFLIRVSDLPRIISATVPDAAPFLGPPIGRQHTSLVADQEFQNIVALRIVLLQNLERSYLEMKEHLEHIADLTQRRPR